jgi:isoquinoline 1-oxidoreductase beta subunit
MNAPLDWTQASPETSLVIANVSRRKFLQTSALGGLVLAVGFPASLRAADAPKYGADGMPHGWVDSPLVFVAIGEDGIVSTSVLARRWGRRAYRHADDRRRRLEADWSRVRVVQATGDEARYGNQDTDGWRSAPFFMPMRRRWRPAADAGNRRRALEGLTAKFGKNARRPPGNGRKLGYGALAKAAARRCRRWTRSS